MDAPFVGDVLVAVLHLGCRETLDLSELSCVGHGREPETGPSFCQIIARRGMQFLEGRSPLPDLSAD